jgi:ketosteroid isomerase-like protein
MAVATNEQVVQRLNDDLNHGNVDVIDELFAEDFVVHPLMYRPVPPPGAEQVSDRERVKAIMGMNRAFANGQVTIERIIDAGDYVTVISRAEGRTKDGRSLTGHAVNVYRMANGKIAEDWVLVDRLGTFQQLGIIPETIELQRQAGMRP